MRNHGRIQVGGMTDIRNELGKRSRPIGPLVCASRDRMPPREDDDLSLLRALADDLILDVAEGWRWPDVKASDQRALGLLWFRCRRRLRCLPFLTGRGSWLLRGSRRKNKLLANRSQIGLCVR